MIVDKDEMEVTQAHGVVDTQGHMVGDLYELEDGSAILHVEADQYVVADIVMKAGLTKQPRYELGQDCTIEDHRPCELNTAAGFALDISQQEGTPLPSKLDAISHGEDFTEPELYQALKEWQHTLPPDRQQEAVDLLEVAFPSKP